jgi:hypothetical protein
VLVNIFGIAHLLPPAWRPPHCMRVVVNMCGPGTGGSKLMLLLCLITGLPCGLLLLLTLLSQVVQRKRLDSRQQHILRFSAIKLACSMQCEQLVPATMQAC